MSKYRPVDVRVWTDRKVAGLPPDAKLLWLFLLTAPSSIAIPGVVIGGDAALAEQLGVSSELFGQLFRQLFQSGLSVLREGRLIWLPKALKYQPPRNPNMLKAWAACWDDVPENNLKHQIWEELKIACKSWQALFRQLFAEPLSGLLPEQTAQQLSQEQDQEQKQEQIPQSPPSGGDSSVTRSSRRKRQRAAVDTTPTELTSVRVILDRLGAAADVAYRGCDDHVRLIVERLRDGITEAELRAVVAYCADEWDGKPEMRKYLRPETLFGPSTIHKYLDAARTRFAQELAKLDKQTRLEVVK